MSDYVPTTFASWEPASLVPFLSRIRTHYKLLRMIKEHGYIRISPVTTEILTNADRERVCIAEARGYIL